MRDFFISALDKIVGVIVVLLSIAVVIGAIGTMFVPEGGLFAGLAILIGGAIYVLLVGGMLYLFLGIYANTKRMADALEKQNTL